jgi:hypothetical protein
LPKRSRKTEKRCVHLGQKVPFVLARFQVSAAPRLENPHSDEKDALFGPRYTKNYLHFLSTYEIDAAY